MGIRVHFYNGAKTKSAWDPESPDFIDGWKPENRTIRCEGIQVTYGTNIKMYKCTDADGTPIGGFGGSPGEVLYLRYEDHLLVFDGVFYGDFDITCEEN